MSMPDYADIWETTDTVVMERPGPRHQERDEQKPSDEEQPAGEVVFLT